MENDGRSGGSPGEGKRLGIMGDPFVCKAVGEDTDDGWSLFEATVMPGSVVPEHRHEEFDEAFYILEGKLEMSMGGETRTAAPGHFVTVRRGTVHGYRNATDEPARYLAWAHPAGIEHFYEEISANVKRLPDDLGKVLSIASKHRIQLMPPREG